MATTPIPAGLTVQQWDNKYYTEYMNKNWFSKFMGTGSNSMIQVQEDLTKEEGDSITCTLVNKLKGTAKSQNEDLEGNEEAADLRSHKITIREYAHAVSFKKFDNQKTGIALRQVHKDLLMDWNMELDRDNIINALGSINGKAYGDASEAEKDAWLADNADRCLFGAAKANNASNDHSASLANVDAASDMLTPGALSLMKRMAKNANPKIRPFQPRGSIEQSDSYVIFANSLVMRDLIHDADFKQANREARQRGSSNPLFKSANYIWDNLYIYEVEDIPVLSGVGNGGIDVSPVYLCGAQAICQAWAKRPETKDEAFDYGRKKGIAIMQWYEEEKLRFGSGSDDTDNPKDHGVLTGFFASVADS